MNNGLALEIFDKFQKKKMADNTELFYLASLIW